MEMSMTMLGCRGRDHTPTLEIKKCPSCGSDVEVFSTDVSVDCENCGFTVYNDAVSCARWCKYAKSCVGEDAYEQLMQIAEAQERRLREQMASK